MPRQKKERPTKRKDGRYVCRYKGQFFYSKDPDDCIRQREEYKEREKQGRIASYFVKEYAEKWLDRAFPNVAPSTKHGLKTHLQKLTDAIGDLPVSEIKPSYIKDIYTTRYKGMSDSYIKAAKQLYCSMFDAAVADGLILSNPARDKTAKPHKGTEGGHRAITPQEREWIHTYCKDHRAFPAVMAMLYAGIRPQEAKAMKIDRDIDFKKETVTVRETAHIDRENGQHYEYTQKGKTKNANRTIPLLPPLKDALEGREGDLITSAHGERVTRTTWRVVWNSYITQMETAINGVSLRWYGRTREHKKILADGGKLPPWKSFTVVPYDLRHSFCTMCRDNGVELNTCRQWMGHADVKMILKIYDEVTGNRDNTEAERLKAAFKTGA